MTTTWDEAAAELRTIGDLLRFAVSRFGQGKLVFGHGFADARTEAAYLLAWALQLPHESFDQYLDAALTRTERETLLSLLQRRVDDRVPAAYLTGEAWLGDHRFRSDPRALIPRSFIAELFDGMLTPWVSSAERVERTLDLCTGSGCLAILLADAYPNARIDAVDLSPDALALAADNVRDYGLESRIELLQSDLFTAVDDRRYQLIVSNPPYVDGEAMATLPPEYRHEPALGLAAGHDGLDLVRRILARARKHLDPGGVLLVEIGHNRDALEAAFPDLNLTWLDTSSAADPVFLVTREDLPRAR